MPDEDRSVRTCVHKQTTNVTNISHTCCCLLELSKPVLAASQVFSASNSTHSTESNAATKLASN